MPAPCCIFRIETPEQKCARLTAELEAANAKIALLEAKLDHLIRRLFGSKGEKINPAQLELLFRDMPGKPETSPGAAAPEEAASNDAGAVRPAKIRAAHRSCITGLDRLPVETTEIIPDLVAADPEAFERCGEEVTELLDITPARFFKRRIVRVKFRRKVQRNLPPIVAPVPATPLVGGLPAAGLLAHRAPSAKPSPTDCGTGTPSRGIWRTVGLRPTTTSSRTPCARSSSARRTGSSSDRERRDTTPQ